MTLNERQNDILNWVQQVDYLSIETIVERFDVSAQTIRKDVNHLAELHLVRRQHGGIALMSTAENIPFDNRQYLNGEIKQGIAKELAQQIPDGASIFLGIGTTVESVAKELQQHKELKVFTNNLTVAAIFASVPHVQVRVTGGNLRQPHRDLVGEDTLRFIRQFYFDYGVIGCGGLDETMGVLDFDPEEASVSRAIIEHSRYTALTSDHYKWGRKAMACVTSFQHINHFVTDEVTAEQSALLAKNSVKLTLLAA